MSVLAEITDIERAPRRGGILAIWEFSHHPYSPKRRTAIGWCQGSFNLLDESGDSPIASSGSGKGDMEWR